MRVELPRYMIDFLDDLLSKGKGSTMKQYQSGLRAFVRWLSTLDDQYHSKEQFFALKKKDYQVFTQWLVKEKYSYASINRIATTISSLQTFLEAPNKIKMRDLLETPKTFPLNKDDFITDKELVTLINSFSSSTNVPDSFQIAHKILSNRNISITLLMRYYGLTPAQLSAINMNHINLSQNELTVYFKNGQKKLLQLQPSISERVYAYLQDIEKKSRPKYHSEDPLFVPYNNKSNSFQYDYDAKNPKPKRLAERSIMKMLKVEVSRAKLRPLSSTHFRNRAILDQVVSGEEENKIMSSFGITFPYYLKRFETYLNKER
ncbi:site-specific integrase [Rossellomorea sp. BNER]|uniref:site-specific integrase n=1 Tax=Rossellomorea sp. BNER TaxID=2962031 RepID=UPI003AF20BF8|nr:site-specific integrase [Rossellomorea sp. BNER]